MDPTTHENSFPPVRMLWPPPGLEGSQGAVWRAVGGLGFGGTLLALPILLSATIPQSYNSLGLLGSVWWALGLTSLLGLLLVIKALGGLFGFLRNARRASLHGIDLETILQVGADLEGDMGSLIQGTRSFRSLDESDRLRAVWARIWSSLLFLSTAGWIAAGWALTLLLAGRGLLNPTGVWVLALGPAGLSSLFGLVAKGVEGSALRGAFGPVFWNRWRSVGLRDAAGIWGEELTRFRRERGERFTSGRGALLGGTLAVVALGASVSIPSFSFLTASAVGPSLAHMAVPKFSTTTRKAGEAQALRYLRLDPDPTISPDAAGEALHVLASMYGINQTLELLKAPVRTHETRFLPEGTDHLLPFKPHKWPIELIPLVLEGPTPEAETFLRKIASHPGLAEFETLARAQSADFLGARYVLPFPGKMTPWSLPIPRFSGIREGSYSMVAKAALQLMDGHPTEAEGTLRTLLSAGLLMGEESTTLIGSLIGYVLVTNAADALETLYDATGRPAEAEALRRIRDATKKASELVRQASFGGGVGDALEGMPRTVLAEEAVRGLRWEFLHIVAGLSPCINPNQILFGPGEGYQEFLTSARAGLVRYPSEGALFDLMANGWVVSRASGGRWGAVGNLVSATLGERSGRCSAVLSGGVF